MHAQMIFDTLQLQEFEVIATTDNFCSALNKSSIDSLQRREYDLSDMGELLAATTPVFVKSYGKGSLSTVSFRGTGASHTKVIWEGFNINSPMLGQTDFSTVPTSLFNTIELNYGGSSLAETGGALGGTISLGNNGDDSFEHISVSQSVGSFNTFSTSVTAKIESNSIVSTTDFFRQSSPNDFTYYNNAIFPSGEEMKQANADYINWGFTEKLQFTINDKHNISITSWNQWNNRNIPTIMPNVEKGGDQKEWQDNFFSRNIFSWKYNGKRTTTQLKTAYFHENLDYFLETTDHLGQVVSKIDSKNNVNTIMVSGNTTTSLSEKNILKSGIKFVNDVVSSNNYSDKKTRNLTSAFCSLETTLSSKFKTEILVRSELVDNDFSPIMPMLGINYKPFVNQEIYLRLNISRNYNQPSLNDLYWFPGGNDSLNPEESREIGLSADYSVDVKYHTLLVFRAAGYISSVDDWIMWTPGDYQYWSPQNIAKVLSRGIELSAKINGKAGKIKYNIFAGYNLTITTNESPVSKEIGTNNIQLMYVPRNSFNGLVGISLGNYYLNWGIYFTDKRNTSLNNDEIYSYTLPAYTLNNVTIGKKGQFMNTKYELRIRANNIFNVDYQAVLWRAMPQRNFEIIANIKF